MDKIKGLIDAPFTPFYENGEVNYEPIEDYAKLLVKNGLKGVFINGSSGEGYMLTEEERKAEDFLILGVAEGYGEACEVVRTMVDDMYRHTDGFNWKSYMAYLGEAR